MSGNKQQDFLPNAGRYMNCQGSEALRTMTCEPPNGSFPLATVVFAAHSIVPLTNVRNVRVDAAGRDLIGRARTGSGKTLAFALPVVEKLMARKTKPRSPGCIVLAPTRELAKQVEREFAATGPTLRTACVYGGVPIQQQMRDVARGADIVVGTPGRIMDLQSRGALDLSAVGFLLFLVIAAVSVSWVLSVGGFVPFLLLSVNEAAQVCWGLWQCVRLCHTLLWVECQTMPESSMGSCSCVSQQRSVT